MQIDIVAEIYKNNVIAKNSAKNKQAYYPLPLSTCLAGKDLSWSCG